MTEASKGPRILVIDIETTPHLGHVWGLFQQNVGLSQLADITHMMCFAAKWLDEKKIMFFSEEGDNPGDTSNHEAMVQAAWDLLDEADIIIGWNSRSFDIKHINREFLLAGMSPPSPFQQLDLLQIVRNRFRFASNKLDHVADQLGVGKKVKHIGFELWLGCMANDHASWKDMEKYNRQDVKITDEAYLELRDKGWINGPHMGAFTGIEFSCPTCGSGNLQKRGSRPNKSGIWYQNYCCNDCGAWSKSAKADPNYAKTTTRNIPS